jgi:hypothetical protein
LDEPESVGPGIYPEVKGERLGRSNATQESSGRRSLPAPDFGEYTALAEQARPDRDLAYVHEAATGGISAYIVDCSSEDLQNAIDITFRRVGHAGRLPGCVGACR